MSDPSRVFSSAFRLWQLTINPGHWWWKFQYNHATVWTIISSNTGEVNYTTNQGQVPSETSQSYIQRIILTKSRIFLHKEIVLCKPPHMENHILWQSGNTISHPCYARTHNFSNGLTIKLLQYVEEWNLRAYNSKISSYRLTAN